MNNFISFYRDPLFSIIIIISIIVLIAIADFIRNRFKQKSKKLSLENMAKNFEFEPDSNISYALDASKQSASTLLFIADLYVQNGNFDEAIKIYLTMLDKTKNLTQKMEIFEQLGNAYYKAGFMQRAKDIFIEILKHNPRNQKTLLLLMQTYETLGEYKSAYEVISCLEELSGKMEFEKNYLKILSFIHSSTAAPSLIKREILQINKIQKGCEKIVLNYLKNNDLACFWELLGKQKNIYEFIDLAWNLNMPDEKILQNKGIADIFRAKGQIKDEISCDIFELEALRVINSSSNKKANLGFKYRCKTCQQIYPFEQLRCGSCGALDFHLMLKIMEFSNEKNYSLI